jgi:hypothetical protein
MGWCGLDSPGAGIEGSGEHSTEPSGSIKCWGILENLSDWQLLKNSVPWNQLVK